MRAVSTAPSRCWRNICPQAAEPLRHAAARIVPLKAHATLGIEPVSSTDPRGSSKIKLALDGTAGALRMKFGAEAAGDIGALMLPEFRLDAQISATDGTALVGAARVSTARSRWTSAPATLSVMMRSARRQRRAARCAAERGRPCGQRQRHGAAVHARTALATALDVTLQAADASPLRRGASRSRRRCCRSRCARS